MENLSSGNETGTASEEARTSKSTLVSRNITILGRRTSVRLEPEMWMALKEIAKVAPNVQFKYFPKNDDYSDIRDQPYGARVTPQKEGRYIEKRIN